MKKRIVLIAIAAIVLVSAAAVAIVLAAGNNPSNVPTAEQTAEWAKLHGEFIRHGYHSYERDGVLYIDKTEVDKVIKSRKIFGQKITQSEAENVVIDLEAFYYGALKAGTKPISDAELDAEIANLTADVKNSEDYAATVEPVIKAMNISIEEYYKLTRELMREGMTQNRYLENHPDGADGCIADYLKSVSVKVVKIDA